MATQTSSPRSCNNAVGLFFFSCCQFVRAEPSACFHETSRSTPKIGSLVAKNGVPPAILGRDGGGRTIPAFIAVSHGGKILVFFSCVLGSAVLLRERPTDLTCKASDYLKVTSKNQNNYEKYGKHHEGGSVVV